MQATRSVPGITRIKKLTSGIKAGGLAMKKLSKTTVSLSFFLVIILLFIL